MDRQLALALNREEVQKNKQIRDFKVLLKDAFESRVEELNTDIGRVINHKKKCPCKKCKDFIRNEYKDSVLAESITIETLAAAIVGCLYRDELEKAEHKFIKLNEKSSDALLDLMDNDCDDHTIHIESSEHPTEIFDTNSTEAIRQWSIATKNQYSLMKFYISEYKWLHGLGPDPGPLKLQDIKTGEYEQGFGA